MTKLRVLAAIGLPALAAAAAFYALLHYVALYEQHQTQLLTRVNQYLKPNSVQLECTETTSWWGVQREAHCRVMNGNAHWATLQLRTQLWPWGAKGQFGLLEQGDLGKALAALPDFLRQQQGRWQVGWHNALLQLNYQSGNGQHEMWHVAPIALSGSVELTPSARQEFTVNLPSIEHIQDACTVFKATNMQVKWTRTNTYGNGMANSSKYQIKALDWHWHDMDFALRDVLLDQAGVLDKRILATLLSLSFETLRISSALQNVRIDPTQMTLYLDGIDWVKRQGELRQTLLQYGPQAMLMVLLAPGLSIHLENFSTAMVYTDQEQGGFGLSGDAQLKGHLGVSSVAPGRSWQEALNLHLELSLNRSLMVGPHAHYVMELLHQGWLADENGRLHTRLSLQQGNLTANERVLGCVGVCE